jgi:hypothetical protein
MVLITLVMLNMIMAVVLDIYTEVKYWATGKNIESAWTTTFDIVASPILRRHWVPESELVEAFEKEPKKKILDEEAIKEKFPDIDPEQLESLMELCEATHAAGTEQASGTLADTMRLIALTKQNLDKIEQAAAQRNIPPWTRFQSAFLRAFRRGKLPALRLQQTNKDTQEMKEIPSAHRHAVQCAVQREMNAIFCELQEEVREHLARMRTENQYRRQRAEEEILSMQGLCRRFEEQVRELEDLNAGVKHMDIRARPAPIADERAAGEPGLAMDLDGITADFNRGEGSDDDEIEDDQSQSVAGFGLSHNSIQSPASADPH